jgi:hypothetical protein
VQDEEQAEEEEEESEYAPSGSDAVVSESDESELSGETEESEEDSGMCLRNLSQIYFNFVSLLERSNRCHSTAI